MAYYKFPLKVIEGNKIILNNQGNDLRDFTHISDVVAGIYKLILSAKKIKNSEVFNFGANRPVKVKKIIHIIKKKINLKFTILNERKNKFDPYVTNANIARSKKFFGYNPKVKFEDGYNKFLDWFLIYHKIN